MSEPGTTQSNLLRGIPSVGDMLNADWARELALEYGAGVLKFELRAVLDELRREFRDGGRTHPVRDDEIQHQLEQRLRRIMLPDGRKAINATGILLHTGLGRSPLCEAAVQALGIMNGYSVLQASLDSGDRSLREERIERYLRELVGAEAATVVNNNAAATMLILNTLAAGKEVIISRGQLIEIGGSFRMTEVMAQSGAILREVGTTNRTHLRDYAAAITENTGAIIHVHTSNYRVRGFAGTPEIAELVELANQHNLPVIDDLGSGAIVPLSQWGISNEPLVKDSLKAGAAVSCFSSDKLICGPQGGLICGRKDIIARIRKNPYARMFRVCKLTLAALEATLLEFINDTYRQNIPFYRMMDRQVDELEREAQALIAALQTVEGIQLSVQKDLAYVGSGSLPDEGLETRVVEIRVSGVASDDLARALRQGVPSVFGRLKDRNLILDMRTLLPGDRELIAATIPAAIAALRGASS